MNRVLYVDPIGGAAGDMLVAALIEAGAPIDAVRDSVEAVLPGRFSLEVERVTRAGLGATLLRVHPRDDHQSRRRSFGDLDSTIQGSRLDRGIKARAGETIRRLARAEWHAHGHGPTAESGDELQSLLHHDVGDDDTLLDVVGFTAGMAALGAERMFVGPLPLGGIGAVEASPAAGHPQVPLPAPAVVELLERFVVLGAGREETVTPTAAAILAALGEPALSIPAMRLEAAGYGAGFRDPGDRPNVVRVFVGTSIPAEQTWPDRLRHRWLMLLEANLDDLTPELVADAAEALVAAGALDAWTAPIQMKKGRPAILLSALCEVVDEAAVRHAFFESTSTFGVRSRVVQRAELDRRSVAVQLEEGSVRVKVGLLGERVVSVTPEHDDVAELAGRSGRAVREVYEEATAAARSLRFEPATLE